MNDDEDFAISNVSSHFRRFYDTSSPRSLAQVFILQYKLVDKKSSCE